MRNTQPISVTLPHDMAAMVKAKVTSGEYASESEVIRDGLRTLQARDAALENWLRGEVAKSYDEFAADPSVGIPAGEVMTRLRASYRERLAKPETLMKQYAVIFTPRAERQLATSIRYIADQSGEARAENYVGGIVADCHVPLDLSRARQQARRHSPQTCAPWVTPRA